MMELVCQMVITFVKQAGDLAGSLMEKRCSGDGEQHLPLFDVIRRQHPVLSYGSLLADFHLGGKKTFVQRYSN